jgi:hypothetical protein
MPSFQGLLSDEEIRDIILYLHTLKPSSQTGTTPQALVRCAQPALELTTHRLEVPCFSGNLVWYSHARNRVPPHGLRARAPVRPRLTFEPSPVV